MNSTRVKFQEKNAKAVNTVELAEHTTEAGSIEQQVVTALRHVYDPELPVNIYDLGLIYEIEINNHSEVFVRMTLTAPGCPVAGSLPGEVECSIKKISGVSDAHVELVWDPPWSEDNMSDEAKLALGLF